MFPVGRFFSRVSFSFFSLILLLAISVFGESAASAQAVYKSDYNNYPKPPLPALPKAGGTFTDPVFGTTIMRATDEADGPAPGLGTYYSHWPTFNADNTKLLIRKGDNG